FLKAPNNNCPHDKSIVKISIWHKFFEFVNACSAVIDRGKTLVSTTNVPFVHPTCDPFSASDAFMRLRASSGALPHTPVPFVPKGTENHCASR
ncbi:MAG: hypothetical protein J6A19_16155, partial [Oscillospiraceae bacterium]|nr:hypothetical protein [Oscillospiraceae bacterium]